MKNGKWYGAIGIGVLLIQVLYSVIRVSDTDLHVIFCDVGQGDAILIRTPDKQEIVIDGGPNTQVLSCLSDYLPFWDRTLTMIVNTHPHYDHFRGLIDVLERYKIQMIGTAPLYHDSSAYMALVQAITQENAQEILLKRGHVLTLSPDLSMRVLGPDTQLLEEETDDGMITNTNPPSLILELRYGDSRLLFPGDSDGQDIERLIPQNANYTLVALPHHGSEHGYTQEVANHIRLSLAVASAGKDNKYGHPHESVQELLKKNGIPLLRTDKNGTVHIVISKTGEIRVETQR